MAEGRVSGRQNNLLIFKRRGEIPFRFVRRIEP